MKSAPTPIPKTAFAERAGVKKQTIGELCKPGGPLHDAVVDGKIDTSHRAAKAYLKRQTAKASAAKKAAKASTTEAAAVAPKGLTDDGSPEFIVDVTKLTLAQIEDRCGGRAEFDGWLKSLKLTEEIREKRLKNDETDGTLIPRELVATHVFGAIDEVFRRLLTDSTKTITRITYANARAGVAVESAEKQVRADLAKVLEPMKRRASKALRAPL